jgi:hypothetical protein
MRHKQHHIQYRRLLVVKVSGVAVKATYVLESVGLKKLPSLKIYTRSLCPYLPRLVYTLSIANVCRPCETLRAHVSRVYDYGLPACKSAGQVSTNWRRVPTGLTWCVSFELILFEPSLTLCHAIEERQPLSSCSKASAALLHQASLLAQQQAPC